MPPFAAQLKARNRPSQPRSGQCSTYHSIPSSPIILTLYPLRATLVALLAGVIAGEKEAAPHDISIVSPLFRPGSGAVGLQPSSHELASTLTNGRLPDLVTGTANAPTPELRTERGTPLVSISSLLAAVTAASTLLGFAAVGAMMHRHHHGGGHGGHRPLGSAHIPANHIGKIPPTFDPRFEDKYSFRQYMRETQHWVLVTDLPPHQQAVMILRHLGGAAYDLIAQMPPNEL